MIKYGRRMYIGLISYLQAFIKLLTVGMRIYHILINTITDMSFEKMTKSRISSVTPLRTLIRHNLVRTIHIIIRTSKFVI